MVQLPKRQHTPPSSSQDEPLEMTLPISPSTNFGPSTSQPSARVHLVRAKSRPIPTHDRATPTMTRLSQMVAVDPEYLQQSNIAEWPRLWDAAKKRDFIKARVKKVVSMAGGTAAE